jgi:hypothetical protein
MAGTFTGQVPGGTTVSILAGRQYANHTDGSNEPSELSEWAWTWTAPAVDVGPVTFYLATNKSNADGLKTGDVIYLSQHVLNSSAGLDEENTEQYKFHVAYNANENKLNLNLLSLTNGTMFLNLVDSKGSSAITMDLGNAVIGENKTSVRIPSDLKSGIYYVNLFIGNYPVSAKVVINQ